MVFFSVPQANRLTTPLIVDVSAWTAHVHGAKLTGRMNVFVKSLENERRCYVSMLGIFSSLGYSSLGRTTNVLMKFFPICKPTYKAENSILDFVGP